MTLRMLSHRIGVVVLCLIPVVLAATACDGSDERAGCNGSEECVSVSQVKAGLERVESFSFGGSDRDVVFETPFPGDFDISYSSLPSSCPKDLPIYGKVKLVYASAYSVSGGVGPSGSRTGSEGTMCVAYWDTDDPADKVMAFYQEAFSKAPWSIRQVAPVGEDGSAWLSFNHSGEYAGLLGVGPTGGPYTIALWWEDKNGGE